MAHKAIGDLTCTPLSSFTLLHPHWASLSSLVRLNLLFFLEVFTPCNSFTVVSFEQGLEECKDFQAESDRGRPNRDGRIILNSYVVIFYMAQVLRID